MLIEESEEINIFQYLFIVRFRYANGCSIYRKTSQHGPYINIEKLFVFHHQEITYTISDKGVFSSDGSRSKMFDLGRVGSKIYGCGLNLENFP